MTEAEARVQIEAFKASIPGVERWRRRLIETAALASPPSVETIGGRRRVLPSLGPDAASTAARFNHSSWSQRMEVELLAPVMGHLTPGKLLYSTVEPGSKPVPSI